MSREEYEMHRGVMDLEVNLAPQPYAQRVPEHLKPLGFTENAANWGIFTLRRDCGYLDDNNRCTIHAMRPRACRDYAVGSSSCRQRRREIGLDGPVRVDITPRPDAATSQMFLEGPSSDNDAFVVRIRRPAD
jgi:Fe-S-cluster containining protein